MTKTEAGRKGGNATVEKRGRGYMKELARKGAAAFHAKYKWVKMGTSDFALIERSTGRATGATMKGWSM